MEQIIVKKTFEITEEEWSQLTEGFNQEFNKEKNTKDLKAFYAATVFQFSYHAMAFSENGEMAGHTSFAPMFYSAANGQKILTCLSGSSFVKKAFRNDIFIFKDMYSALAKAVEQEGAMAVLGVPNKNSFKYFTKLLNFTLLFYLPYYVLPLQINKLSSNKFIGAYSFLFRFFVKIYLRILQFITLFFNPKETKCFFTLDYPEPAFRQRFNDSYNTVKENDHNFTYKIYNEKNISTAYVFDFREKGERTFRSLIKCCRHIVNNEKADILVFVGKLDMKQIALLKLPVNKEPQRLPLTVDLLVKENNPLFKELSNADNWNFGLMNFDVR